MTFDWLKPVTDIKYILLFSGIKPHWCLFFMYVNLFVCCCQVAEGDSTGSLTNGLQTATAATALPSGHEVITGKYMYAV